MYSCSATLTGTKKKKKKKKKKKVGKVVFKFWYGQVADFATGNRYGRNFETALFFC